VIAVLGAVVFAVALGWRELAPLRPRPDGALT
jgi:hypothetical protein